MTFVLLFFMPHDDILIHVLENLAVLEKAAVFHLPKILPSVRDLIAFNSVPEDRINFILSFWLTYGMIEWGTK